MIFGTPVNRPYRVVGIDPGTNTLGFSVLDLNVFTGIVDLVYVTTLKAVQSLNHFQPYRDVHGDRSAKLHAHKENLREMFCHFLPTAIICESPFLGKFPQAFEALVECKMAIRAAVYEYDPTVPLETVDPPTAKMAVGAPGKSKDKEDVKRAILRLPIIQNLSGLHLESLDEHSIDSIAVGFTKCQQIRNALGF